MERKIADFRRSFVLRFNAVEFKQTWLYLCGGFLAAITTMPEMAPLFLAYCAYALRFAPREMCLCLLGSLAAFLILPSNALIMLGALITLSVFALISQFMSKQLPLWQMSLLLGAICLTVELTRHLWLQEGYIYAPLGAVLAAVSYYSLAKSHAEFHKWQKSGISPSKEQLIYPLILITLLLWGAGSVYLGGLSLLNILFALIILLAAYYVKLQFVLITGLLLGLFGTLTYGMDAGVIGYLGICSLIAALGQNSGKIAVWGLFMLGQFLLSWMVSDWNGLIYLLAEDLIAGVLFLFIPDLKSSLAKTALRFTQPPLGYAKIAQTIGALGHFRPMPQSTAALEPPECSAKIYMLICHDCPSRDICWQKNSSVTVSALNEAYQYGLLNGTAKALLSESFKQSCRRSEALNEAIIAQIMLDRQEENHKKHLEQLQQVCADELVLIGQTLHEISYQTKDNFNERALRQYLFDCKLPVQYVHISTQNGTVRLEIVLKECINDCAEVISSLLSNYFHREYQLLQRECSWQNEYCRLFFHPSERCFLAVHAAQRRAEGETLCGDLWRYFKIDEQTEAVFLIDGMGIGDRAYRQSLYAADMLEELLKSAVPIEKALKLINNHLLLSNFSESFVTLEVLIVNLLDLSSELYKAAGATSYLLHAEKIEKITASSLPLGILSDGRAVKQRLNLQIGDRLFLFSDGLAESREDWAEYLPTLPASAEAAANELIARTPSGHDDQSAVIIDIWSIKQNGS